jgi:predicted aspartyl protease
MIDTGFTGFLSLPIVSAIPLGLTLFGTSENVYADGSTGSNLMTWGTVLFGDGKSANGPIGLSPGDQPLLGMSFLRITKNAILITSDGFTLLNEEWLKQFVTPPQTPPTQK